MMPLPVGTKVAEWERIQEKTFSRWVNSKLAMLIDEEPISNLTTDFEDGVYLTYLVSYLSPYSIEPLHKSPKHRLQKMENLNAAFDFIKYNDIHTYNIGAEDILEGNLKLILGLIWTLILHFSSMQKSSDSTSSLKEKLLLWCQRVTKKYKGVNIRDFTTSWSNGLGLCAMIHHFRPELIDFSKLKPANKLQNATLALEIATKKLKIPQLIDVEDLICDNPDEKSVTAYIIEWHHKFEDFNLDEIQNDDLVDNIEMAPQKFIPTSKSIEEPNGAVSKLIEQHNSINIDQVNLLNWCNEITKELGLTKLTDFSSSFLDGIALCAIMNALSRGSIDVDKLNPENGSENVSIASNISSQMFGVPLEVSLNNSESSDAVDDKLVTYLELVRQASCKKSATGPSLVEIEKFVDVADDVLNLEKEYEDRAAHLIDCLDEHLSAWGTLNHINHCKNYKEVIEERSSLNVFRLTLKRKWLKEKAELSILLSNIKTKLATFNLHPYHPPGDLSPKFIDCLWLSLTDIEKEAFRRINLISKRIQDELCQKFATSAELIKDILTFCEEDLANINGDLDVQLEALSKLLDTLKPLDEQLAQLIDLEKSYTEAEITCNEYTLLSYDELHYELVLLKGLIVEKLSFLESQGRLRSEVADRKMTAAQVEEFTEIFKAVDKRQRQFLSFKEFQYTLKVLSVPFNESEALELFEYGKEERLPGIKLSGFLNVMRELVGKDDMSADSLIENFMSVAGGKSFLTEDDMLHAKFGQEVIHKIQRTFPKYQKNPKSLRSSPSPVDDQSSVDDEAEDMANTSYDFIQFVSEIAGLSLPGEGETLDGASIKSQSSRITGVSLGLQSTEGSSKG